MGDSGGDRQPGRSITERENLARAQNMRESTTGAHRVTPPLQASVTVRSQEYALLNEALAALPAQPDAVHQAVLSFARIGLYGPVRDLITDARWGLLRRDEYRALLKRLEHAPTGRIEWSSLTRRFENNSRRLLTARPHLAAWEQNWRKLPERAALYRSLDGNHHLLMRGEDGVPHGRAPLLDVRGVLDGLKLPHGAHAHTCPPYALCDDRFGALLSRVFDLTRRMLHGFAPRLYALEHDEEALGAALYLLEDIEPLCHERVELLIGPDCVERLQALLDAAPERDLPRHVLGFPATGDLQARVLAAVENLTARRAAAATSHMGAARQWYANHTTLYWSERFARPRREPLRVLGLTSRFTTVLQYAMRDLRAAFERRGHRFHTLIEPTDHDLLTPLEVTRTINEFRPDLVIAIDHTRAGQNGLIPDRVPFVCWVQDLLPHLMTPRAGESMNDLEFFIAPELHQFVTTYRYPAERGLAWTLATDAALYSADPLPEIDLAPHRCDVSYVSNQSQTPEAFVADYLARSMNHDKGRVLCEWLWRRIESQVRGGASPPSATLLLPEAREATGIAPSDAAAADLLSRTFIHPLSELIFRQSTLEWVAAYCEQTGRTLRLYGLGWESHPRLGRYACGVARNGVMLRAVYQASRVNLQVIGSGAVHQRLLDGLAAGGFFLIRSCPLDHLHEPVTALLDEVDRLGLSGDATFSPSDHPVLAAALATTRYLRGLAPLPPGGDSKPPDVMRITSDELAYYRDLASSGYRRVAGAVFADYASVSFSSREELRARLDRYLECPQSRAPVAARMREVVLQRFTYDSLIDALLDKLARHFRTD